MGSRFRVQARLGATGRVYEIAFTFYGIGFPSPHLNMPSLSQEFKGYNRWTLQRIFIKNRKTRHTPLGETALQTRLRQNPIDISGLGLFNPKR